MWNVARGKWGQLSALPPPLAAPPSVSSPPHTHTHTLPFTPLINSLLSAGIFVCPLSDSPSVAGLTIPIASELELTAASQSVNLSIIFLYKAYIMYMCILFPLLKSRIGQSSPLRRARWIFISTWVSENNFKTIECCKTSSLVLWQPHRSFCARSQFGSYDLCLLDVVAPSLGKGMSL